VFHLDGDLWRMSRAGRLLFPHFFELSPPPVPGPSYGPVSPWLILPSRSRFLAVPATTGRPFCPRHWAHRPARFR